MLNHITISPNIQSGMLVFTHTRVPVKNLFDYPDNYRNDTLEEFLNDFPSVKKGQALAVLEQAENSDCMPQP